MRKTLKWIGIILGTLLLIAAIVVFTLVSKMNSRMEKVYSITPTKLEIPKDSASIAQGRHFAPLCQSCHGEALQGKVFFTDPNIGTIYSPNLTSGKGGIGGTYTDVDWVRSIRHGIAPKGNALFVMPSKDLHNLGENDLACLIAYVKSIPPVDNSKGENVLPVFTKILMQIGAFGDVFSAETIDHNAGFQPVPPAENNKEYGKYLVDVAGCKTCHGAEYNGGKSPDPNSPPVPNLTPAGNLAKWTPAQFVSTLRTGTTPENKNLNDTFMPWKHVGQLSDLDLNAVFTYFRSLPKKETGK